MKTNKNKNKATKVGFIVRILIANLIMVACFALNVSPVGKVCANEQKEKELTIVFTHDLHSKFESFYVNNDGKQELVGGFAKIKTVMDQIKEENPNTLVVDGGDFSMGTLYQTIFSSNASELRLLGKMGVEVTTFGNHEFDYRSSGLMEMLQTARKSGDPLPDMVLDNVDTQNMSASGKLLYESFREYGVEDYVIKEVGGYKVAVIGGFGEDALACAPMCDLSFVEPKVALPNTVNLLKETENPDFVIYLSHGGTNENSKKSEDELLAKAVTGIDFIVSGHTHSLFNEPIIINDTVIGSCGEYGQRIGKVSFTYEDNKFKLEDYTLIPIDETIEEDEEIATEIKGYKDKIEEEYLNQFGYEIDRELVYNPYEFETLSDIKYTKTDTKLGSLLADAYIYSVKQFEGDDSETVDIAVVPSGVIRDTFAKDKWITVSDVFNVFSLGIGEDKITGYPLISVYLTGKDVINMLEVNASVSDLMTTARLYVAGVNSTIYNKRLFLNKVRDGQIYEQNGKEISYTDIDPNKMYRVITDYYTGQMLGAASSKSFGILSITPYDRDGNAVEDLSTTTIQKDGKELKAWVAIASYLDDLSDDVIPEQYETHAIVRVTESDDFGPSILFTHLNTFGKVVYGVGTVVVILIILIIIFAMRKRKRKQ